MPGHTTEERKKRRLRGRSRPINQARRTNDIIAASQEQLAGVLQQQGAANVATATPAAPVQTVLPPLPESLALPADKVRRARRLRPQVAPSPQVAQVVSSPDEFKTLNTEGQVELERRITSRAANRRRTVAGILAGGQGVSPFESQLRGIAAESDTLEVRGGRLRAREDVVVQAKAALPGPSPLSPDALAASREEHRALREKQATRRGERRLELSKGRGTGIGDVLFERATERRAANIEAGGSIGRLRRQRGAAAERAQLIEIERLKAAPPGRLDPSIVAAGLRSPEPGVPSLFAKQLFPETEADESKDATPRGQALRNAANELGRTLTPEEQSLTKTMTDIGGQVANLGLISRGEIRRVLPIIDRAFKIGLDAIKKLEKGPERDKLINSMITSLRNTVGESSGFLDKTLGFLSRIQLGASAPESVSDVRGTQVNVVRFMIQQLEILKSARGLRARDQGSQ